MSSLLTCDLYLLVCHVLISHAVTLSVCLCVLMCTWVFSLTTTSIFPAGFLDIMTQWHLLPSQYFLVQWSNMPLPDACSINSARSEKREDSEPLIENNNAGVFIFAVIGLKIWKKFYLKLYVLKSWKCFNLNLLVLLNNHILLVSKLAGIKYWRKKWLQT